MAEYVVCPECEHRFRPPPRVMTGRRVRCPACDGLVDVATARQETEDEFETGRRPRSRRRRSSGSSSGVKIVIGLLAAAGVLMALCCGGLVWAVRQFNAPTEYSEQTQDYVEARRGFRTRLLVTGPAPQDWAPEIPPPGAMEVEYPSGNLRLKAWISQLQPGPVRSPAVLFLHGGFAFGEDDWRQTQPFRSAGFAIMTPILRGENGLAGNYSMFYDEVDDVLAAAEFLARQPNVDANRIYVAGHSAGGTLTLLAAMSSKRFRAAASFSGSPDQRLFARGQEELVPFDANDFREFQMRSPLAFPRSFKCPVRIYYGSREFGFEASSKKTAKLAKAAKLDVEAIEVTGDHFTAVAPAMQQAITFFKQH